VRQVDVTLEAHAARLDAIPPAVAGVTELRFECALQMFDLRT
jgi:hypothetical protein